MRIVFALFIILYTAAVLSFTLPRQEQEAIVALKRAIPSLPSKWPSFSDSNITDCNATFPGLTCTGASVTSLDLSSLGLCCSGSIPQEIGYFTNLSTLALPGIGLTGSIPNSVAGLTKLTTLSLQNNKLSGSIPNFFFSPGLTSLFLQNNSLTGHIPSVSANTLKDFNLDSNSLDGSVPAWLGDQTYSALTSSSVNIGGQAGGKAYTGCAPRLHRGAAGTSCNYYNDSGLSCYCPGECSASPCTCPLTGITGTAASCSDHTTIYTGGTSTSTAQTGNILYYRCETTLCKYDLSTSTQTKLTTNAAGDVYLGGNSVVYFYDATSVSTIDAAGAVTIVLPSIDTTTVKVFPSTTGILIYTAANGLYKISGSVQTPIIDSTTLSTNAVVEAIEVGSNVLFTKSVDPGVFSDTSTTTPVCGVSTDVYSNLVVGPTNTAFVYKRTTTPTDSLVTIDVSGSTCNELTTTPESPNIDNPAAIYFGSFLYYYTSGKNIAKVDTSATPGVVVTANTLSLKPVFFVAQTHLFASLDNILGYFNGTLFEQLNSLFNTPVTTLAIVDNQLFGNFNGDLREWNSGTKAWSGSLGTIPASEQVLVPGSTSTIAYIDTASGDIRLYKNLYSACKFPNQCTYTNKATCVPNFVSSVSVTCTVDITCNTTVNTLLDGSCVPKDLCALTSSCPQFGMSCTLDSSSSPNCTDIDQCATGAHRCLNRTCINTNPGFYTCAAVCPTGYEVNGAYRCQDTDECQTATTCSGNATCNNTVGNYTCTCNTNYTGNAYVANGCYKTNPCGDNPCSANADCNNTGNGAFTCTCHTGFNGSSCTNIDECQAGTHNCSVNAICTDTPGSFNCTCKPGYNGTGYVCNNIDECTAGTHNCSADATCTDTPGSFNCTCKPGYTGNGNVCTNVNECQGVNNCSTNANCTDTPGSYTCTCKNGYSGNGVNCTDINECANSTLNNCNTANGTCTNTNGSYTCACKAGYTGNGIVCNDIDECANATLNTCSSNATCTNTNGNFTCACKSGYSGDGYTCTNIDECQTANNCSTNAVCTDKPGTYNCTCKSGYTGNGFNCTNINECLNTTICGINAFCTDFSGGYNCTCNTNYSGDAYVQCYDDAPCRSKPCDTNADCAGTATPGGFTCTCKSGWTGNGTLPSLCTNINECLNTTACVPNAICADTNGSFTCTCDSANGYTGNGNWNAGGLAGCYFADPCLKLNPCDSNATCSNQGSGKYSCTCKGGFSGVGNVTGGCYYTSPCTTLDPCGANSVCNNTGNGNYNCSCSSGYQYNSSNVCVDIDECEVNNQCPSNTTCTNSDGSFDCACLTGYRGATTVGSEGCAPIDGCQEIAGICGSDTSCTPSGPNKTDCACLAGFQGIPPNCKCVISGTFSGCALTANGTIVINGTATASTTVNAHTSISAGATLLAPSVAVVNFMNGVDVQGTFDIRNADAVQVSGGLQIGNDGVLKLGSSSLRTSNLRISNCQSNTIAGQVILTLPPNPQTVTWNIESTCALSIPSNIISLDSPNADCAPPSASALTNGIVTITVDCSPKSPPAPDTPIGAIVGGVVGGVVVIVLIIIFAVPSIRNKILRNDDDFGDSDDSDDKPKNKPPARNTSENSRTGKPIPNPPFNVTAIADYMAVDTSQISVTKGVIYTVQRVDEGQHWFQAKGANGKLGWFPASYARIEN